MKRRSYPPDELAPRRARPLTPESAQELVDMALRGLNWLAADPTRIAFAIGVATAIGAWLARDPEQPS